MYLSHIQCVMYIHDQSMLYSTSYGSSNSGAYPEVSYEVVFRCYRTYMKLLGG